MQSKPEHLERLTRNVGLEINIKKTKVMITNNTSTENIMLQGQIAEYVDSFCYLDSTMTTNDREETDIGNSLNRAKAAFRRLHSVWKSLYMSKRTKLRIFKACVKSTSLYNSETWLISSNITQIFFLFF